MPEIPQAPSYNLSQVDLANNALDMIGQRSITSFDDGSEAADIIKRQFPAILSAMLRDHDWNFATRRSYLPQIDPDVVAQILAGWGTGGFGGGGFGGGQQTTILLNEPSGGYSFWYALPNNFIRAWQINNTDDAKFAIEYGSLLTDESPALLRYTAYIDDPNLWDAMFRLGIETLLASRLCGRITGNLQRAEQLKDEALGNAARGIIGYFSQAKAVVGQEGTVDAYIVDDLTTAIREL